MVSIKYVLLIEVRWNEESIVLMAVCAHNIDIIELQKWEEMGRGIAGKYWILFSNHIGGWQVLVLLCWGCCVYNMEWMKWIIMKLTDSLILYVLWTRILDVQGDTVVIHRRG